MQDSTKSKLVAFYDSHKRMPSYSEMMKMFGYKSKNAVYRLVTKLVDAGVVAKDKLGRLIPSDNWGEIPLIGSVKAGFPSVAEELTDTVNLEDMLIKHKESTYLFEVDGKSMIDAHIDNGDMVLAERTSVAREGDIVIANVDGEFTMKYFRKTNGKPWLEPANKAFKPIHPKESLTIVAVVKAVIRKY
jgi:repressor LexA